MNKVLITGATGLIGAELIPILLDNDFECWVVGRSHPKLTKVHYIEQDLGKTFQLSYFPKKMDYIIHLAQADNHNVFPEAAVQGIDVNVRGMVQLLDYAVRAKVKKFLFASSGGIYGTSMKRINEQDTIDFDNNLSYYLNTKLCMEVLAQNYKKFFNIIVFRIFFAYGEGQKKNMLFSRLIESVKQEKEIEIHSIQDIKMNPIYKEDVARCIYKAMQCKESRVFNIAGAEVIGLGEIVHIIGEILKKNPNIKYVDDGQMDIVADVGRMLNELWVPQVHIKEGIKRMVLASE